MHHSCCAAVIKAFTSDFPYPLPHRQCSITLNATRIFRPFLTNRGQVTSAPTEHHSSSALLTRSMRSWHIKLRVSRLVPSRYWVHWNSKGSTYVEGTYRSVKQTELLHKLHKTVLVGTPLGAEDLKHKKLLESQAAHQGSEDLWY